MLQVAQTLSHWPIAAVYSSPVDRAMESAAIVAAACAPGSHADSRDPALRPLPLDGLGEIHFGEWEGRSIDSLANDPLWQRFNECRSTTRPPGGEWITKVQTRFVGALEQIVDAHPAGNIAVVSHCDPIRAALCSFLGIRLDHMLRFEIGTGGISSIAMNEGAPPRVVFVNQRINQLGDPAF